MRYAAVIFDEEHRLDERLQRVLLDVLRAASDEPPERERATVRLASRAADVDARPS